MIISFRKRLFDTPDARKIHTLPIPRLGGVTFFPAILFTMCFLIASRIILDYKPISDRDTFSEYLFFLSGLTLLYIIGIADDLIGVRYRKKFAIQILAALMFPLAGLYINDFYGLFGIQAVYGIVFAINHQWIYALLSFVSIGVIIPFFRYNVFGNASRGRKIFMGDTGSLTLGYILSFFTIKYCMHTETTHGAPILIAFCVLMVPCLDVVRVVFRRLRNRKNPFLPDKIHIHHKFLAMGFTPRRALIYIQIMSATFCAFTIAAMHYLDNTLVLLIDVAVWIGLNLWFDRVIERKQDKEE